jgi:hypothetical protein
MNEISQGNKAVMERSRNFGYQEPLSEPASWGPKVTGRMP